MRSTITGTGRQIVLQTGECDWANRRRSLALIEYLQNLRIEEAKRLLESSDQAVDEISVTIGYEDASFFRRLFKRRSGVAPAQYRRVFKPIHKQEAQRQEPRRV
jgi:AraC-like DNA-binding protein